MSGIKNKNFSFKSVVFSSKLFSVIAATMLLLLVDGAIHDAPAPTPTEKSLLTVNNNSKRSSTFDKMLDGAGKNTTLAPAPCASMDCVTGTPRTQPQPTQSEAVSNSVGHLDADGLTSTTNTVNSNLAYFIVQLVVQTEYSSNGNSNLTQNQIKELYNAGVSPQQMYDLTVTAGFADSSSFFATTCAVFWCSFAPPPPTQTQNASIQQTQQYPSSLQSHQQRLDALEKLAGIKNDPNRLPMSLASHQQRLDALEKLAGIKNDPNRLPMSLESHQSRLSALEQAFANNPPTTEETSVTQGIVSTGHSTTQQPQQDNNILSNFTLNGMDPSTKTGLVAAAAIGIMGGITAGVVTAVNNQAQQAQQEQNSKNLWAIVAATAKGAASGGPSCQCNSAIQTSPPYCTGAGICQCGAPNCPP